MSKKTPKMYEKIEELKIIVAKKDSFLQFTELDTEFEFVFTHSISATVVSRDILNVKKEPYISIRKMFNGVGSEQNILVLKI